MVCREVLITCGQCTMPKPKAGEAEEWQQQQNQGLDLGIRVSKVYQVCKANTLT